MSFYPQYEVYDHKDVLVIKTLLRQEAKPYADKFKGYVKKGSIVIYKAKNEGKGDGN